MYIIIYDFDQSHLEVYNHRVIQQRHSEVSKICAHIIVKLNQILIFLKLTGKRNDNSLHI